MQKVLWWGFRGETPDRTQGGRPGDLPLHPAKPLFEKRGLDPENFGTTFDRPPPGGGWHAKRDWGRLRAKKVKALRKNGSVFLLLGEENELQRRLLEAGIIFAK